MSYGPSYVEGQIWNSIKLLIKIWFFRVIFLIVFALDYSKISTSIRSSLFLFFFFLFSLFLCGFLRPFVN